MHIEPPSGFAGPGAAARAPECHARFPLAARHRHLSDARAVDAVEACPGDCEKSQEGSQSRGQWGDFYARGEQSCR